MERYYDSQLNSSIIQGFSQLRIYRPPPLRNGPILIEDTQCSETKEKSILRFLIFELRSNLYSKFVEMDQF